ncbi:tautomerase family protein [Halomonas sp. CUBES01]|uniref:tautomerase family protein n=1 Tax=Halomonas sp. CUBES01 TaxID=2897340 RepID=UPI001E29CEC7|nr:tautomerase family protein [Halomonas sp. CUBES01]MEC4766353.1 tautomerase family protein [Halomonas sp. CUBES01]
MPIITVSVCNLANENGEGYAGSLNANKYHAITERLTESTARVLKKDRELVVVKIMEIEPSNWFVSGAALCPKSPTFDMDIKITEDTNSHEEVSTWVREAYETMKQFYGDLAYTNYISVTQVPAEFWGYNGLTQSGRRKWIS